jgi:hypothetical protein
VGSDSLARAYPSLQLPHEYVFDSSPVMHSAFGQGEMKVSQGSTKTVVVVVVVVVVVMKMLQPPLTQTHPSNIKHSISFL